MSDLERLLKASGEKFPTLGDAWRLITPESRDLTAFQHRAAREMSHNWRSRYFARNKRSGYAVLAMLQTNIPGSADVIAFYSVPPSANNGETKFLGAVQG